MIFGRFAFHTVPKPVAFGISSSSASQTSSRRISHSGVQILTQPSGKLTLNSQILFWVRIRIVEIVHHVYISVERLVGSRMNHLLPGEPAMLDLSEQNLMSFAEVTRRLPPSPSGKKRHVATIHRWRRPGVRGVRLEAIRIGHQYFTSWSAVTRFVERISQSEPDSAEGPSDPHASDSCQALGF